MTASESTMKVRDYVDSVFIEPLRILIGRTSYRPLTIVWWVTFFFVMAECMAFFWVASWVLSHVK
jgi:hypothetical protein